MKFAHVLSHLVTTPWFIMPDALGAITNLIEARLNGVRMDMPAIEPPEAPEDSAKPYDVQGGGNIAIISINGVLGHNLGLLERSCGGVDYQSVIDATRAAVADPTVSQLLFLHNSRGGTAIGCTEAYRTLAKLRADSGKPFLSFCTICGSADYYLAAASDKIFVSPTSYIGCIGSMLTIEDNSEALAKDGKKRLTIKSASMKDIGNPDRPATPEEIAVLEGRIAYLGGMFKADMQAARPGIASEVFDTGLAYHGPEAISLGLADALVESLDELMASLATAAI